MILYIITYLEAFRKDTVIDHLEYPPNFPNYCSSLENREVSSLHQNPQGQHCTLQEVQKENYSVIN
jgi:hypothetical protein